MTYDLNEILVITIEDTTFDEGLKLAYQKALWLFGADESWYLKNVPEYNRSVHGITIEFVSCTYRSSMAGQKTVHEYRGWVS